MEYTILGRTGLRVSVMGLGGGGHSRLGLSAKAPESLTVSIIQRALALGVNFIDTAEAYGTESAIGKALTPSLRHQVILSSKVSLSEGAGSGQLKRPEQLEQSLEASLRRLNTDYLDIYHLHAVKLRDYDEIFTTLVPVLLTLRDQGKVRFLGITEGFVEDPAHRMLERALQDPVWDVMMVGFNLLNQSARKTVLASAVAQNLGILDMFAVRRALSRREVLAGFIADMVKSGLVLPGLLDPTDPLGFLIHPDGAQSLPDAAYRFVRHEPGIHVVLSGTGNLQHLEENADSINRGPLPDRDIARLREVFANVDSVSGN